MNIMDALEAYVSREIPRLYSECSLVAVNETLLGGIVIDFHFRKDDGTDVFVEVTPHKVGRTWLNHLVNVYTALSNFDPPLKSFELVVVAPGVSGSVRGVLEEMPVELVTFEELGIDVEKARKPTVREPVERVRLSPDEAKLVAMWESGGRKIIRPSDVQDDLKCTPGYAYFLLHGLEDKGWIERVTHGVYQFIPLSYGYPGRVSPVNPYLVGSSLVEPYYFSYYTSNSHYGFTTQVPSTVYVASTKSKPELEWSGTLFKFVTLSKDKFFGYREEKVLDTLVYMASPEKSLVDSFDKPKYAGGVAQLSGAVWRGLPRVDVEKLVEYAVRMGNQSLVKRMGFIVSFLMDEGLVKPPQDEVENVLLSHVGESVIYLDSGRPKTGDLCSKWKVVNNVPRRVLLSEIGIG